MFQDKTTRYFDEPGPHNTEDLIGAVRQRANELGIRHIVVASDSGSTALRVAEGLNLPDVKVVCVTAYAGIRLAWPEGNGRA